MTTQLTNAEIDAALAEIAAEQEAWFSTRRHELAAKVALSKKDTATRVRMVSACQSERAPEVMMG